MQKKDYKIGKNDAGQRLDRFLTKKGFTIGIIRKALRNKDIKVNGKRFQAEYMLNENDMLQIYYGGNATVQQKANIDLDGIPTDINIVYEDENILLLNKPQGLLCHSDEGLNDDNLINRVKAYLYKKGEFITDGESYFEPSLCNRIDRNTSGIVIAAKNAETLRVMNEKIKTRQVKKLYLCVLAKIPKVKEATITAFLEKNEKTNTVKITDKKTPTNKTVITKYKVLRECNGLALAEVDLLTGRTHQIRAHLSYIGCPILGDGKYGYKVHSVYLDGKFKHGKQALCSYKLKFCFDVNENNPTCLDYLNGKSFEVDDVWFKKLFS